MNRGKNTLDCGRSKAGRLSRMVKTLANDVEGNYVVPGRGKLLPRLSKEESLCALKNFSPFRAADEVRSP